MGKIFLAIAFLLIGGILLIHTFDPTFLVGLFPGFFGSLPVNG